ncbi:BREX-1 system adenine-specific DNA-methyltransferase PglX [Pigmentiphaga daeguensis]|uniref:BREX-1 system adenine-specific DNA-methyltransferase PglX n=1 Tax=Pigmentiphaga daeguensis TaxID=414049 RepID=UPI0031D64F24
MSQIARNKKDQGMEQFFFRASTGDFKKIPGDPIAYWTSDTLRSIFQAGESIEEIAPVRQGFQTGDNDRFLRYWHEVSINSVGFGFSSQNDFNESNSKYAPYNKGGEFRKWYGNNDYVVLFNKGSYELLSQLGNKLPSRNLYFKDSITWSALSSGNFGARYNGVGYTFSAKGACAFPKGSYERDLVISIFNSLVCTKVLEFFSPTLDFNVGALRQIPLPVNIDTKTRQDLSSSCKSNIAIGRVDWDSHETSWDFASPPLLRAEHRQPTLKASYQKLRTHWREMALEMQRLEEENNRVFIDAYGLQDELTPEVPLKEITLTCNPHYRYGGDKSEEELEALLLADSMRELVSYAVGCMFGRYSLDKPGLILANQGDTLADYLAQVPQPRFPADEDNVIPLLDGDWFADDITLRLRQFLRVAFGDAHYEDNLAFIEQALNVKGKRNYGLRDYLLGEFYADHVKRYKKRPIYWLFSSPKGNFNALIYMHRYRPDTVSVVLRYLRDYREKLTTEKERQAAISINPASSQGEKTRALKETERLGKVLAELEDYERNVLYPLATQQVQIDLDDGVKVNYLKFEGALKKIPGLAAKDED